jgi:hypothetical protein
VLLEAPIQKLSLTRTHIGGTTPIGPAGLAFFVIVIGGIDVHNSVNEAQNKSLSGPIYDDIDSHIIAVHRYFFCI